MAKTLIRRRTSARINGHIRNVVTCSIVVMLECRGLPAFNTTHMQSLLIESLGRKVVEICIARITGIPGSSLFSNTSRVAEMQSHHVLRNSFEWETLPWEAIISWGL